MDGYVTIGTELNTKDFDAQIDYIKGQLDDIEDKLKQADMGYEVGDVQKLEAQYEKLSNRLKDLIQKKEQFNKVDFSTINASIDNVGKGISSILKKVARWGLAVFGIRSAYMAVRNAINTIAGDDEQLKADIDYMKNAIAYTLEPVVRRIVELAKQLLFYIGYLINQWTGKNIFENANKSLKKSVGSAKELKKTLTGFDEMNVVSDTSGGGTSGGVSPSFDLSNMDGNIPGWLDWLAKNGGTIVGLISGIVAGLSALKISEFITSLKDMEGVITGIKALGIGILVTGIVFLIQDIIDLINDPSWENFVAILGDIAIIIGGIMLITGNWWGLLVAFIGLIVKLVAENWDTIKEILGKVWGWINEKVIQPVANLFSNLWGKVKEGAKNTWNKTKEFFSPMVDFFSGIINKIVGFFKKIGTKVGDALGSSFKTVINGVLGAVENILNFPIKQINKLLDVINKVPGIEISKLSTFNLPRLAKGGIVNMPSRGVPIGNAIVGEKGQEGVIPLTDSQQMELLGEAIGKYININATVPVYVGNRMVARELKRINAEDNFAYNR